MEPCLNNPFNDPEFWDRPLRRFDPEFDDVEEDLTAFQFVLDYGPVYTVMGEQERDEEVERLTGDEIGFVVTEL